MKVTALAIPDVLVLQPKVFGDSRGFFYESYNEHNFCEATGIAAHFVQAIIPAPRAVCSVACTIRSVRRRVNSSVWCVVLCSMWRWIFGALRRRSGAGLARSDPSRTNASYGSRRASRTDS